ncbi:Chaperone protein DnaJ [Vanrija pseudolonga]|uniref:Chaperone protein DnaJ n=1 Tax=Vanrija pseudolonga TaxID=143232 RepID=A0AAF0Y895_9TREE|nr:Chaperone protein DnaJ [Vanrija pseudolonga]
MWTYLSPVLWSLLPGQAVHAALPILSGVLPALLPPSQPGTSQYLTNYRRVLTAGVLLYLGYIFATDTSTDGLAQGDWYAVLGVSSRASDDELRRAFRGLSRIYHPDRVGGSVEAANRFIAVRQAYEGLSDPIKRFAHDRFGPQIARWNGVVSSREYIHHGLLNAGVFYGISAGFLVLFSLIGQGKGAYWRYTLLLALLVLEASLLMSPSPTAHSRPSSAPILSLLPRPLAILATHILPASTLMRPQYQHIALAHRLFSEAGNALAQLAAAYAPQEGDRDMQAFAMASVLARESVGALAEEITPVLAGASGAEANLLERMEQVLLDKTLPQHPATAEPWAAAMRKQARPDGRPVAPLPNGRADADAASVPLPVSPPETPQLTPASTLTHGGSAVRRSSRLRSSSP